MSDFNAKCAHTLVALLKNVAVPVTHHLCCRYELYDPCAVMVFYKNKTVTCDFGNGSCSAYVRPLTDCQVPSPPFCPHSNTENVQS